jgi:transcriptional regulator with XRE-family HTH domain
MELDLENLQSQIIWQDYRNHRKQLGVTQKELARRLGVTQGLVTRYETGTQGKKLHFRRPLEGTIEMCIAIDFPTERFIPNLPTQISKVADCRTLYVALASNEVGQAVSAFGISIKEAEERLRELDSNGLYQHDLIAEFTFKHKCVAYVLEDAVKAEFDYKRSAGEYLNVKPEVIVDFVAEKAVSLHADYRLIERLPDGD